MGSRVRKMRPAMLAYQHRRQQRERQRAPRQQASRAKQECLTRAQKAFAGLKHSGMAAVFVVCVGGAGEATRRVDWTAVSTAVVSSCSGTYKMLYWTTLDYVWGYHIRSKVLFSALERLADEEARNLLRKVNP